MAKGIQIIDPEERFKVSIAGATFMIRRLDTASLMALERRHKGGGKPSQKHTINDDILDYILQDWQQVGSPVGGGDVPCTRENKLALPTSIKLKLLASAQGVRADDASV